MLVAQGRPGRAVTLLTAGAVIRDTTGAHAPDGARASAARMLEVARAQLDEEQFAAAAEEGRSGDVKATVGLVLGD